MACTNKYSDSQVADFITNSDDEQNLVDRSMKVDADSDDGN